MPGCDQVFLRLGLWLISGVRNLGTIGGHGPGGGSWGREAAASQGTARAMFGHLGRTFTKLLGEGRLPKDCVYARITWGFF